MRRMQGFLVVVAGLALLGLFSVAAPALMNDYFVRIVTVMCINAMLVVSMGLANGFTGVFSLGHVGFVGVGAYVSGVLSLSAAAKASLHASWLKKVVGLPDWISTFRTSLWHRD